MGIRRNNAPSMADMARDAYMARMASQMAERQKVAKDKVTSVITDRDARIAALEVQVSQLLQENQRLRAENFWLRTGGSEEYRWDNHSMPWGFSKS